MPNRAFRRCKGPMTRGNQGVTACVKTWKMTSPEERQGREFVELSQWGLCLLGCQFSWYCTVPNFTGSV